MFSALSAISVFSMVYKELTICIWIYSKRTVLTTPTFDFLKDLVEGIPDPVESNNATDEAVPKTKRKSKAKSTANAAESNAKAAVESNAKIEEGEPSGTSGPTQTVQPVAASTYDDDDDYE